MKPRKIPVFAIVRLDKYITAGLEEQVAVQAVLPTFEEAQKEVARLNALSRHGDRIVYMVRATRFYPDGRTRDDPPPSKL